MECLCASEIEVRGHPLGESLNAPFRAAQERIMLEEEACRAYGVMVCEREPWAFVGCFLAAVSLGVPVFLGNFEWKRGEWEEVRAQVQPAVVFGKDLQAFNVKDRKRVDDFSKGIMIPTGGSGGCVRFAVHYWETLVASVKSTLAFLGRRIFNGVNVLPVYHVSGLMPFMRAFLTCGKYLFWDYKEMKQGFFPEIKGSDFVLSLVPQQLEAIMAVADGVEWLQGLDTVFLGGAPACEEVLALARDKSIRISPTYGMTEAASMVTALEAKEFLSGMRGVGRALPGVAIAVNEAGGGITVKANSLFYGYFPKKPKRVNTWESGDEGAIDRLGYLSVVGRCDRVIITGGEKVDPLEIEEAIMRTGLVVSVVVLGCEDCQWGERVVCFYVSKEDFDIEGRLAEVLRKEKVSYKIPKDWVRVDALPIDSKGKVLLKKTDTDCPFLGLHSPIS